MLVHDESMHVVVRACVFIAIDERCCIIVQNENRRSVVSLHRNFNDTRCTIALFHSKSIRIVSLSFFCSFEIDEHRCTVVLFH